MCGSEVEANGLKAVSLLIRLTTLVLALSSAAMMATASECTIAELDGAVLTVTYPPFLFLAGFNIAAAILEAATIYLQLSKGGGGGGGHHGDEWGGRHPGNGILDLVLIDGAVLALLYASTAVTCTAAYAYRRQMSAWVSSGEHVYRSKLCLSLAASFSVGLAAVVKEYNMPQPF